ncbi:hypothetical protein CBM2586_B130533 [Cupriavidus phytorum]|uniref:Uncharacterized protein n=1 Tax=Cupriavidus taiwanensis TaxID=164546 RepID=A0A375CJB7_9BURK|nr:hypothetical protein CBM2586_B130533 [Cupriavidus taiwanensis]
MSILFSPTANPLTSPTSLPSDVGLNAEVTSVLPSITLRSPAAPVGLLTEITADPPLTMSGRLDTTIAVGTWTGESSELPPHPASDTDVSVNTINLTLKLFMSPSYETIYYLCFTPSMNLPLG